MGGRAPSPKSASGAYHSVAVVLTSSTGTTAQEERPETVERGVGVVGMRPTGGSKPKKQARSLVALNGRYCVGFWAGYRAVCTVNEIDALPATGWIASGVVLTLGFFRNTVEHGGSIRWGVPTEDDN